MKTENRMRRNKVQGSLRTRVAVALLATACGSSACGSSDHTGGDGGGAGSAGVAGSAPIDAGAGSAGAGGGGAGDSSICSSPLACASESSTSFAIPAAEAPLGISYPEWGERFFQWAGKLAHSTHPSVGGACAQEQSEDVWFLGTPTPGCSERACTIPKDRHVLVMVAGHYVAPDPEKECQLDGSCRSDEVLEAECMVQGLQALGELCLEVDGVRVANLESYAFMTKIFRLSVDPNDPVPWPGITPYGAHGCSGDCTEGSDRHLIASGTWVMLRPLPPGSHVIRFFRRVPDGDGGFFTRDVYYQITVE
jgi:hypothetical protein